jgi:hypothetical protein
MTLLDAPSGVAFKPSNSGFGRTLGGAWPASNVAASFT